MRVIIALAERRGIPNMRGLGIQNGGSGAFAPEVTTGELRTLSPVMRRWLGTCAKGCIISTACKSLRTAKTPDTHRGQIRKEARGRARHREDPRVDRGVRLHAAGEGVRRFVARRESASCSCFLSPN